MLWTPPPSDEEEENNEDEDDGVDMRGSRSRDRDQNSGEDDRVQNITHYGGSSGSTHREASLEIGKLQLHVIAAGTKAGNYDNILEEHGVVVAKKVLQPLSLKIIPRIEDLRLAATGDDVDNADAGDDVDITVAFTGKTAKFTTLGTKDYESRMHGTTRIIDPFEFIKASSDRARTYGGGCVELKRVCSGGLSVPFSDYTTTDANLRPSKKSQTRLECKISYWTNETTVPMGCALALTR